MDGEILNYDPRIFLNQGREEGLKREKEAICSVLLLNGYPEEKLYEIMDGVVLKFEEEEILNGGWKESWTENWKENWIKGWEEGWKKGREEEEKAMFSVMSSRGFSKEEVQKVLKLNDEQYQEMLKRQL